MNILEPKLLILASAGSGKTYQLSNRIIGLVAKGVEPERIVALTFTRKAAAEFADSVLTKLADAACHPQVGERLSKELGLADVDYLDVLGRISRSLHRITLGTMDSFFARIVRAFQYELGMTGGRFDLIEGPRLEMATDAILQQILGNVFVGPEGGEFTHAFRRASIGREAQGVARNLRDFINRWHLLYRHHPEREWGPLELITHQPEDWEKGKHALASEVLAALDHIEFSRKGQRQALEKCIEELVAHTIASGSLGSDASSMTKNVLEAVATQPGDVLTLKFHKEFEIQGPCRAALRKLVSLAAHCELSAAALRSRAMHEVITAYDAQCNRLLRSRGRLGFDDIKLLMGQWAQTEEARLRREAIDFRLDARIDHWLLDEFQDTSPIEWTGLLPLIDEAASDDHERTMFIVGDRKQAIYAWRGGDVSLFDKVIDRYSPELKIEPLDESWRSCPEVLALVNRVCGDGPATRALFGEEGAKWDCPTHVSAPPLLAPEKRGHARVEMLGGWDEKYDRMEQLLRQLGVGTRALTCGILLRGNEAAAKAANELRARGFDVILEGQREPGKDSPVGVAVSQLLGWLADPGNLLARGVVEMSPLHRLLTTRHGESWEAIWNALCTSISSHGYHHTIAELIDNCGVEWSAYSQRRIQDILLALGELDLRGNATCREVAQTIARLSIPQSPGVAAIQVMTIHKSKGLGFDVVILPEIPSKVIPEPQHYKVMQAPGEHGGWLSEAAPQWARKLDPQLADLEQAWGLQQQHEAMCTLYVALTRAKRGLYVLLDTPSESHDFDKPSLSNWLMRTTGMDVASGADVYEQGSFDWVENVPELTTGCDEPPIPALQPAALASNRTCLSPVTPSRTREHSKSSRQGMAFGSEVHALLESVAWIDEGQPALPPTPVGNAVRKLLENPSSRECFLRQGRDIRLLREQAIDATIEGRWVSGIIDRLHLHRDLGGKVARVEIIDFKTDAVDELETLATSYGSQLETYRSCIRLLHPDAVIECVLLSTHLTQSIRF